MRIRQTEGPTFSTIRPTVNLYIQRDKKPKVIPRMRSNPIPSVRIAMLIIIYAAQNQHRLCHVSTRNLCLRLCLCRGVCDVSSTGQDAMSASDQCKYNAEYRWTLSTRFSLDKLNTK